MKPGDATAWPFANLRGYLSSVAWDQSRPLREGAFLDADLVRRVHGFKVKGYPLPSLAHLNHILSIIRGSGIAFKWLDEDDGSLQRMGPFKACQTFLGEAMADIYPHHPGMFIPSYLDGRATVYHSFSRPAFLNAASGLRSLTEFVSSFARLVGQFRRTDGEYAASADFRYYTRQPKRGLSTLKELERLLRGCRSDKMSERKPDMQHGFLTACCAITIQDKERDRK